MEKRLIFIFNPLSGKGIVRRKLYEIVDLMVKQGYEVTIYPTQKPNDCFYKISEIGEKYDRIVISGGDGTLDETVRGIMRMGIKTPVGYIPAGSTNDFASSLKIPKSIENAANVAVTGKAFSCDVGEFNGKNFIYVAAFGVLTDVSYATKQEMKNALGHAAYFFEGVKRWRGLDSIHMRIEIDGVTIEDDFCYGMVGNSAFVAGVKMNFAHEVKLDDGVFEIVLIKTPKNPVELNRIITAMFSLTEEEELILIIQASHARFHTDEPLAWTLDGEFGGKQTDVEITNCNKAINIIVKEDFVSSYTRPVGVTQPERICKTPEEIVQIRKI